MKAEVIFGVTDFAALANSMQSLAGTVAKAGVSIIAT
jgi:hypothetical protein